MLRCISLLILLPLCVLGQADVLLSTPSKNFVFPTHQPVWEQPHAPTVPPTKSSASAETATTPEQYVTGEATSQPALDSSDSTETIWQPKSSTVEPTTQQTPQPTNSTVAPSTPQPTNSTVAPTTPPLPKVGDYVVRYEWNTSVCLMARMGLQFSFRMGESFQTINLDPNVTLTGGTCGNNGSNSALMLISNKIAVQFIFTNQTNKFFLSALNLTVEAESGPPFTAMNSNLSLWEASLGSSYMCKKEQSFNITDALILNTFELQVQPFGIMNGQFSTAHECSVDDASLLIPIIVGAALAVLILIVVIAYVIGRRKTYVGYQTL